VLVGVVIGGLCGWLLASRGPVAFLVMAASVPPLAVLHEIGHALVATMVGSPPALIQLFGRHAKVVRVRGLVLALGRNPFGAGVVVHHAVREHRALREAAIVAAGPLTGVIVAGGALLLHPTSVVTAGVAAAAFVLTFQNLVPIDYHTPFGRQPSDGLRLARVLRPGVDVPDPDLLDAAVDLRIASVTGDAEAACQAIAVIRKDSRDPQLVAAAALLAMAAGRTAEAVSIADEIEPPALSSVKVEERPGVGDALAWVWLLAGDREHLRKARAAAEIGTAAAGNVAVSLQDTLAWLDLRRGDVESAHRRFIAAYTAKGSGPHRFMVSKGLAATARAAGDEPVAVAWDAAAASGDRRLPPGAHAPIPVVPPGIRLEPPSVWHRTELDEAALAGNPERWIRRRSRAQRRRFGGIAWWMWLLGAVATATVAAVILVKDLPSGANQLPAYAYLVLICICGMCTVVGLLALVLGSFESTSRPVGG
jgi:hypothetical protein